MMDAAKSPLGRWFKIEFLRRTIRYRTGEGSILDATSEYRVTWTEISERARDLGIAMAPTDLRVWWGDWTRWLARMEGMDVAALKRELHRIEHPNPARRFSMPDQARYYDLMMANPPDHGGAIHRVAYIEGFVSPNVRCPYHRTSITRACWYAGQDTAEPLIRLGYVPLNLPSQYARDWERRGGKLNNGFYVTHLWRGLVDPSALRALLQDAIARSQDETAGRGYQTAAAEAAILIRRAMN